MDPATHAVFGALASRAVANAAPSGSRFQNVWLPASITAIAGMFPDIDYLLFEINPLTFLAEWHRSYTHSFVLLPLWTLILTGIFLLVFPALRKRRLLTAGLTALGLASHILLDLLTVYGTKIFFPFSNHAYSLGTTFVVDPILSLIALAGLIISCYRSPRRTAVIAVFLAGAYVLFQWQLKIEARDAGEYANNPADTAHRNTVALPQPFSPFHWRIIIREQDGYSSALIDLLGVSEKLARWNNLPYADLVSVYRDVAGARWERYTLYGDRPGQQTLVRAAWAQNGMAEFRKFALYPVLYRIDRDADSTTCVWFSDLRYHISTMIPSFRYGMCRSENHPEWQRYRLRYFTSNDRQPF